MKRIRITTIILALMLLLLPLLLVACKEEGIKSPSGYLFDRDTQTLKWTRVNDAYSYEVDCEGSIDYGHGDEVTDLSVHGTVDLKKALEAVSRFEGENGFAVLVSTVAEKFFRQLAELKDAQARGVLREATEGMAPWMARKTEAQLGNWSLNELRAAHYRFQDLRERAVSSQSAEALVVPRIVQACRRRRA